MLTVAIVNVELRVVVLVERNDRGGIQLARVDLIFRLVATKSNFERH